MNETQSSNFSPGSISAQDEVGKLMRKKDWKKTPLGDIKTWPGELTTVVNLCIHANVPVAVWWGVDFVMLFNEAFRKLFALNYSCLGEKGFDCELWNALEPSLRNVWKFGKATEFGMPRTEHTKDPFIGKRYLFNHTPLFSSHGEVSGIFTTVTETVDHDALQHLEKTEAWLQMGLSGMGTWEYNLLTDELAVSDICCALYAYPAGEKVDFKTFRELIHPEDRALVEEQITRLVHSEEQSIEVVYRTYRFHGEGIRWMNAKARIVFNAGNQTKLVIGTVQDVTERKLSDVRQQENELKLQLTMQASNTGSFEWNMVTSEFLYNDRLAQIFGYEDTLNKHHQDFINRIHPDDLKVRQHAHDVALETGNLFYEVRVIWPDNAVHWVQLNGKIIYDRLGNPWRMYGTALDITSLRAQSEALEQKVRERTKLLEEKNEQLKRSEERYIKMTDEVQDYAIILLDQDGTIVNWNKGAEKIKGYKEEEIIGRNFSIFYLEEDRKSGLPKSVIDRAVNEGRAMHEGWRKRKDGTKFWGSIVITALHDQQNNVIGFTKVTRDLTERKLAEDMMMQHTRELEIKNKQLEQFAYIASHDLQEPLRKIQTFAQVLEMKIADPEARRKYFSKINSSAKRMSDLIQAVLNYSRLSKSDELFSPVDLNVILENVKTDYELVIAEKNAIIENDKLPVVNGVALQLSQLFANLIGNSLKFSNGQPVITISSDKVTGESLIKWFPAAVRNQTYAVLAFSDNGIGFDQRYAEKIFTIFQRLHSRDNYAGTGIGLALCKRIVENHSGFIQARGEVGKGASFTIYLPFT